MEKETARKFVPLVNTSEFANLFESLIDEQIAQTQKGFEQVTSDVELRWAQGKIQALKKMRDIRKVINQEAK